MHLLPCHPPTGTLERAPRTSLQPSTSDAEAGERWEGFWCVEDERYYARCIESTGREVWYRIADAPATRVLPFKRRVPDVARTVMMLGRVGASRRSMLVGRVARRSGVVR